MASRDVRGGRGTNRSYATRSLRLSNLCSTVNEWFVTPIGGGTVSWNSEAAPDLAGRTYPVTGGNAGVGEPVRVQQSKVDTAGAPGMISCQAARPQPSRPGRQWGVGAPRPAP